MSTEKMVYVPRNWKVSYVDTTGNEHADIVLRANAEYRIVENGAPYNVTVSGIRTEEDKTYILAKVMMYPGFMNTMEKSTDRRFDVDDISEITRIATKYVKANRSIRDRSLDADVFTFAFDTNSDKYPSSQYKISVYAGEFVALSLKANYDPNRRSRSIYGHIVDVDAENNEIKFSRYICKKGVRDIYEYKVALSDLLGIYRYELEINDYTLKSIDTEETTEE